MLGVLGPVKKPETVWQKQFDDNNANLVEMSRMDWDQIPDDYMKYCFHDMAYVVLQPDLFRHFFPACLRFWYETLMGNRSAAAGEAEFHYGLMQGNVLEKMLSENERQSVNDFFTDGMLDRIEAERGLVCNKAEQYIPGETYADGWIWRINSLGIVTPVIRQIWEEWWNLDNPGKAVCALSYASGLVYFNGENPIYGERTPAQASMKMTLITSIGHGGLTTWASYETLSRWNTSLRSRTMPRRPFLIAPKQNLQDRLQMTQKHDRMSLR